MSDEYKYWAFVSYSHQDKRWGDWLHRALETYRVPRRLVGRESRDGAVTRRLYPIFRDNEELPTSADLGGNINEALRQSRYLIVICSPRSAVSRWVNQEITTFKALGREQRILCLIVDGEPNASDNPDSGLLECFPRAIRYHFDQNGQQTSERVEPIAADVRDGKLSRADARLKLVAGLLGVGFDELKRREKRRIFWRRMQYAAAAVVLLAALGVVWLNFFVKQVRTEYFEAGQRELLSNRPDRAAPYLAEAKRLGSDNPALPFLLRQALRSYELQWTNLVGHKGNVIGVRYDATGSRLVTTATDLTARIWDKTGKQLVLLKGHTETIGDAAFSADGAMVVTASIDKSAIVWDASNGARVATLSGHDVGVSSAVFDPAGTRVLTVSGDKARLFDAKTGRLLHTFPHRFSFGVQLKAPAFSPDGRRVVLAGPGSEARVWDVETGELTLTLAAEGGLSTALFSPDGSRILTSADDARVWDANTGVLISRLDGHTDRVVDAEFSAQDGAIVTASWDGTAKVWGPDFKIRHTLGGHRPNLQHAQFSPEGSLVVTSDAGGAKIWDTSTGRLYLQFDTSMGMRLAAISPSEAAVATTMSNSRVTITEVPSNGWATGLASQHGPVTALTFSANGGYLAYGGRGGVSLWNLTTRQPVTLQAVPAEPVNTVDLSADGARLLVTSGRNTVSVWDAVTGQTVATLSEATQQGGFPAGVLRGSIHPDGKHAVVIGTGRSATIWDLETKKIIGSLAHPTHGPSLAQYNPDGRTIVTLDLYRLFLWDASGKGLAAVPVQGGFVNELAFSRDGSRLASLDDQGTIKIWDASNLKLLLTLRDAGRPAIAVAFRPDGLFVVTAHTDGSLKFWDAGTGALRYSLAAASADEKPNSPWSLRTLAFSPNGTRMFVAIGEHIDIWDARDEPRSTSQVTRIVDCLSSWMLQGGALVENTTDPATCQ